MRKIIAFFIVILPLALTAQSDRWSAGGTVGFNCAQLQISGVSSPTKVSRVQPTPAFGVFLRTALGTGERMLCALEFRAGYETTGAHREIYYERAVNEWVRVNDRYSTLPVSMLGYVNPGGGGKFWLGAGLKAQYVISSRVRNKSDYPPGAQGLVFVPAIKKLFPSVSAEVAWSAQLADIALTFCYAVVPLIESQEISVTPMTFALTVKKRLDFGAQ